MRGRLLDAKGGPASSDLMRSGVVLGSFGVRSGSVRGSFGVRSESVRGPFRVRSGGVRDPSGIRWTGSASKDQMRNLWPALAIR